MSLGISSSCFYPLETELAIEEISKNKITCTEIFYNSAIERKSYFTDNIIKIKEETGLQISALHPMSSFSEPYMIFSEYTRRFEEARDDFMRYFETAAELGASFINLHGDRPTGKLSVEEYCQRFGIMAEDAKGFGVTLCQENVNGYRSADPEFLKDMVKELGDLASFTLDIKQCIRAGYTVPEIAEAMDNKICHVHISDHSPAGDCLLPGRGGFDFAALFETLKANGYKGDFMIEVYRNAYSEASEIFESYHSFKNKYTKFFL